MNDSARKTVFQYLSGLTGSGDVEELVYRREGAKSEIRADEIISKLKGGRGLNGLEQLQLEAIIIPSLRPAFRILDNSYTVEHSRWRTWNDKDFKRRLQAGFPLIGRVELPGHPSLPYAGTGFLVGRNLMMTNRHVAEFFARGLGTRHLVLLSDRNAGFTLEEEPKAGAVVYGVSNVVMIHEHWDMALLSVDGPDPNRYLRLLNEPVEAFEGQQIAIVGYPAADRRNPATVQHRVFDGLYEVKRLQPGYLRGRRDVDSFGHRVHAVTHDASTLGGNSGSAALLAPTNQIIEGFFGGYEPKTPFVVALHFAGHYLDANFAVPASDLAKDQQVVDAGVAFEPPIPRSKTRSDDQPVAGRAERIADVSTIGSHSDTMADPEGALHITIPLHLTLRLGAATSPAGPDAPKSGRPLKLAEAQAQRTGEGIRFVLNFPEAVRPDDDALAAAARAGTGLDLAVGPLFAGFDLLHHRLLSIPGVDRPAREEMFDLARTLRGLTGATTVDPDLGTDYYTWAPGPPESDVESAAAFWCWTDAANKPSLADWAIIETKVPQAWDYSKSVGRPTQGHGARIFHLDTGIVPTHSELPPALVDNSDAGNFIEPGSRPVDPMTGGLNPGHGTGTASVAVSPTAGTMRGSAPAAELIPVRCIESVAVFDQSRVAQAIDHARLHGAHIITMSLGGVFSGALHSALRKAVDANIIVLAAAGNCVGAVVWPARYAEAIAVGGITYRFDPWPGSSRGSDVDISGPAEFVLNADPLDPQKPGKVSAGQGTSYATAHLAGLAALWLAHHGRDLLLAGLPSGGRLQQAFHNALAASAIVPTGFDKANFGAGVVDADALLHADPFAAPGLEATTSTRVKDIQTQLAELMLEAVGSSGLEAVAPALGDLQSGQELACLAFDRLREGRDHPSGRPDTESSRATHMSTGLRHLLGDRAAQI